ncbi:hypothetical protein Tdes44962_MAKER06070 [Teratosphaeria destructans]|uniref:Endosomal SPRY domain protein n=1 Tax=Teratosphaeria destructans TaxID=418781 RepID=A0A9W7VXU9_9PEZI|nr:hypothetical protein Tdes44962_MAKER06070 [Teratosphaeria destructans]
MAPVNPLSSSIVGLALSSLELDQRSPDTAAHLRPRSDGTSPLEANKILTARASSTTYKPGQGTKAPESFNNAFFIALFAIIGAAMVITAIWFFFWAKNGGFRFREGDWEDYKSTVLRRKGPDGKTLSNATKSTKLGGGSSIAGTQRYKWAKAEAKSVVGRDEKGRKGIRAKRGWANTHSVLYSDDYQKETFRDQEGTISDMTEITEANTEYNAHGRRYRDRDVHEYKREKPARVGGLNRAADGSHFGTTIAGSETMSESSEQPLISREQRAANREKERAERRAREEAAKMERRWKREAEEAAAALARENTGAPPAPAHTSGTTKKSATPSSAKPAASKQRSASRSRSPKKRETRDFSYTSGPASEILSTAYTPTESSGKRTSSYYDAYRPRHSGRGEDSDRERGGERRSVRQGSPRKKVGRPGRSEGYRRGVDGDLDLE